MAETGSVAAVVRSARLGLQAARALEALLFGSAALALTLAAAAAGGTDLARADAWAAALCAGTLAAASWLLEHRATARDVARALDRRLRHGGALVTAFEVEQGGGEAGAVAPLLLAGVRARLRTREALRAALPPLALAAVAPLFGAAALAAALELARAERPAPPAGAAEGLVASLSALAGAGGAGAEAEAALAEARALAALAAAPDAAGSAELLERVAELDRRLARLAADAASPERRREIAAARSWLDAVRQDRAPAGAPDAGAAGAAEGAGAAPGARVTAAAGDGTMAGSTPPPGGGDEPPFAGGAPPPATEGGTVEIGTAAGAWWPARHDEVVRRWLERARGAGR